MNDTLEPKIEDDHVGFFILIVILGVTSIASNIMDVEENSIMQIKLLQASKCIYAMIWFFTIGVYYNIQSKISNKVEFIIYFIACFAIFLTPNYHDLLLPNNLIISPEKIGFLLGIIILLVQFIFIFFTCFPSRYTWKEILPWIFRDHCEEGPEQ